MIVHLTDADLAFIIQAIDMVDCEYGLECEEHALRKKLEEVQSNGETNTKCLGS